MEKDMKKIAQQVINLLIEQGVTYAEFYELSDMLKSNVNKVIGNKTLES